jgi:hypothetical protein
MPLLLVHFFCCLQNPFLLVVFYRTLLCFFVRFVLFCYSCQFPPPSLFFSVLFFIQSASLPLLGLSTGLLLL